jgi:hypothetical protein
MKNKVLCVIAVASIKATLLLGQFGFGLTVFDPANLAEAINQLRQLEQQYRQLVQTYNMVRNQYDHMLFMARRIPVDMASRYRALITPWRTSSATNTYGTTTGWVSAVNTGAGVLAGYQRAVEQLGEYAAAMSRVPADQADRLRKYYATIELADGANLHTMETVGRLRQNAPQVENAIRGLEDDSLSSDPNMNTEIAVLNKINAASVIALRNVQDSNKLLVTLAEQQIVDSKRRRDSEAQAVNNHIRFVAEAREYLAAQKADSASAMLAYRMP